MKIRNFLIASAALLFVGGANAAVIECVDGANSGSGGANASSSIDTGASGAAIDISECGPWATNDPNDFPDPFYGTAAGDWTQLDKADGADSTLITGTGWGTSSGTFSLNNTDYVDYLIVMKFDGVFSAFLSDTGVINAWGWDTDSDNDNKFAISHLSVYVREASTTVPAPGPLVVMAIGLVGMLGLRRVKKAS